MMELIDILLVNAKLNHHDKRTISPPLGLAYLCAALSQNGIKNAVLDCNLEESELIDRLNSVRKNGIVAFSCMTPNYNYTVMLSQKVRSIRPDLFLVLGGYHATLYAKEIIYSATLFDALILGNGEEPIIQMYNDHLNKTYDCKSNIIYRIDRDNANYQVEKTAWPNNIEPDRHAINLDKYIAIGSKFAGSVQFSRGCVYACNFCSVRKVEGCWRAGNVNQLLKEFELLHNEYGLSKNIVIVDNLFTGNKKVVMSFCDLLIETHLRVKWSCDVRIDDLDEELCKKMYAAGCVAFFVGLESGCETTLNLIGGKPKKEIVLQKLHMVRDIGIKVNASFIIGMPWETEDMILETINYAIDLPLYSCEFSFATPFRHTKLYEQVLEYGAEIIDHNYDHWDGRTPVMKIKGLTRKRLVELYLYAISRKMEKEKENDSFK